ncbi:MAG: hypothetical protein RI967_263 [Planctomycetota bacterium]
MGADARNGRARRKRETDAMTNENPQPREADDGPAAGREPSAVGVGDAVAAAGRTGRGATRSPLARAFVGLAARARILGLVAGGATVGAVACALVSGAAVVDAAVRFPAAIRVVGLAAIVAATAVAWRRALLPAWRTRATPVELALRVERMHPALVGRLASAVDFELSGAAGSSVLAARAVRDAESRAEGIRFARVLRVAPAMRRVAAFASLVLAIGGFAVVWPASARIAAARVLMPWSDARWPARTEVVGLVEDGSAVALGKPVALRARLARGDSPRERVRANYRIVGADGVMGDWIEVLLARQPDGVFERLVEPTLDGPGGEIEVRFAASDSESDAAVVRIVEPARVVEARVEVEPPAYAAGDVAPIGVDFGNGRDARSVLRDPVLSGSRVSLALTLSRPTGVAIAEAVVVAGRGESVRSGRQVGSTGVMAGETTGESDAAVGSDGARATGDGADRAAAGAAWTVDESDPLRPVVRFVAERSCRVEVDLVDGDGIRADEPAVFVIETSEDRAPSATIEEPVQDESVVADARVGVRALARDDVALRSAGVEIEVRVGGAAGGSVLERLAEGMELAAGAGGGSPSRGRGEVATAFTLDVAGVGARAGDSIVMRAFAEDAFRAPSESTEPGAADVGGHGRVRSAARTLRVVDEEEFERQVRAALGGVRRDAMRLDERQARARDELEAGGAGDRVRESQGSVTDGAARLREAVEDVVDRLRRNGRDDVAVADLAEQARDLAGAAQARGAEAGEALDAAARLEESGDAEAAGAARAEAAARQEAVREELEDLVSLLDRDQDAWVARRRVEALAGRVRQLLRETDQAARRSAGESREELSPDARAELDALAERQRQASSEAEQVMTELRERAEGLQESDRSQAKALEDAIRSMEEGEVREELDQAASESEANRLEQSKAAQERAAQALSRASEALSQDRKLRAKELARALEELVDSVKRLLEEAIGRRGEVALAPEGDSAVEQVAREPLAMSIGLLSQNARGLGADARAQSREAAKVARKLDAAATSLSGAAASLRAQPFRRADVSDAIEAAIRSLEDALREAEEAADRAEERADEEKRVELLARYRGLLEQEVGIRAKVDAIPNRSDASLPRRSLVESRRLGTVQEELRQAVVSILDEEQEVRSSDALVEMHDVIDSSLRDAKEALSGGRPDAALVPVDDAIEALATIVAALDEAPSEQDDDAFGEEGGDQAGGGEGGSGGAPSGAVPPVAEIKILRGMQESLMRRTRLLDELGDSLTTDERARRLAEIAMKQERIVDLGQKIADKIAPKDGVQLQPDSPGPGEQPTIDGSDSPSSRHEDRLRRRWSAAPPFHSPREVQDAR